MARSAGLLCGTLAAAFTHGLSTAEGKGGWIAALHDFPSQMAQNFWISIFAWTACFVITIAVSLMTRRYPDERLRGLVYGVTEIPWNGAWWCLRLWSLWRWLF